MPMSISEDKNHNVWRIDRRVPAMMFVMLALQIGAALVWAGAVGQRIDRLEAATDDQAVLVERTVRLEEQLRHALGLLDRIEGKIDKIDSRSR